MSAAATTGATIPYLVGFSNDGSISQGDAGLAIGAGLTSALAGTIPGRLGNVLHEGLETRLSDPQTLLRNHHIHALTAEAVAFNLYLGIE